MKTDFMRKIDYHVGIPVCFLFSCFHRLSQRFLNKDRTVKNPTNILFIKFFGMGTIVLATPAIRRCRDLYPEAEIHFLTFSENRPLFALVNILAPVHVITIRTSGIILFASDVVRVILLLWRLRFDVVIDLEFFSRFTAILSFLSRARSRIGFYNYFIEGLYRGNFLTHKTFFNHFQHTSLAFLDMVETLRSGKPLPFNKMHYQSLPLALDLEIALCVTAEERNGCVGKFELSDCGKLVLLNPNVSEVFCDLRRWPLSHYAALSRKLLNWAPDITIGIIGAKKDIPSASELEKLIGDERVINFAGRTSLLELCVLIEKAECMVSNDSGPSHLAALTNTHIITLFGPETPSLYKPLALNATSMFLKLACSPCWSVYNGKRSVCHDNICLQEITPDMVYQELVRRMQDRESFCQSPLYGFNEHGVRNDIAS